MVPPGRHTRTSSSAVAWWCGANIAPTQDITTSKLSSANGSASASASTHSSSTPRSAAIRRPASKSSGVRSLAVTIAPAAAAGMAALPEPGGDVEDAVAGLNPACTDELGTELRDQLRGDGRVVA